MKRSLLFLLLGMILLFGCGVGESTPAPGMPAALPLEKPTPAFQSEAAPSPAEPSQAPFPVYSAAPVRANPLMAMRSELFSGSGSCAACHQKMRDAAGNDVSNDRLWRSTMMANAARDPYWQATVRKEGLENPEYQEVIEDKCVSCHMPMGHYQALHDRIAPVELATLFGEGLANLSHPYHSLGIDGVSCSLCHQIEKDNLNLPESFSGGYRVDVLKPAGQRIAYGPFQIPPGQARVMQVSSGFIPEYSAHIQESALCGVCHVLHTNFFDDENQVGGEFNEQMVFTEWLNSSFPKQGVTCQKCHMPEAHGGVQLSTTGGPRRSPFSQHVFVGGNTYIPRIFAQFGAEMGVTASVSHFETTIANAANQIQTKSAEVILQNLIVIENQLEAEVAIHNLSGHKFPTGYPSRRAWLHFTVRDTNGEIIFESGRYDERGMILTNQNDLSHEAYEPHYEVIASPDQVQIYETIMYDSNGHVTTALMRSAGYAKDNRLLPDGFEKITAEPGIGVYGLAVDDPDFSGGGDRVKYVIALGQAKGPFTVEVRLLYQTISFRWAENLRARSADEIDRFIQYYDAVPNMPLVAGSATARAQP